MPQASLPFEDAEPAPEDSSPGTVSDQQLAAELIVLSSSVAQEIDERDDEELATEQLRLEVVEKVLSVLRADAARGDDLLRRADLERQCFRRSLTVSECIYVEQMLTDDGILIEDSLEDLSKPETDRDGKLCLHPGRFLTELEERELGRKVQLYLRAKDSSESVPDVVLERLSRDATEARAAFIETNIRWLRRTAAVFAKTKHLTEEDLFQEGVLGLIRATELWDPERGYRFKTYAGWWVSQKIHRAIADGDRTVRLPVHVVDKIRRIRKVSRVLSLRNGEEPGITLLASTLGMTDERLVELLWTVNATDCLDGDAPIAETGEGDGATPLLDFLRDDRSVSAFDVAYKRELKRLIRQRLQKKEAKVIIMRFGFGPNGEHTLEEIGQKLNLTRERIRQIEKKALEKLKPVLVKVVFEKAIDHGGVHRTWGR